MNYRKFTLFALAILLLYSCDKKNHFTPLFSIDISAATFLSEGGEKTISLQSNVSWNAQSNGSWLTVNPESGIGNAIISLLASANETAITRTGVVTFIPEEGESIQVNMSQDRMSQDGMKFSANLSKIAFGDNPESNTIRLTTNMPWEAEVDADWLTVNPIKGNGMRNEDITVIVDRNKTIKERAANITLTPETGEPITVLVTQEKENNYDLYLLVGQSNMAGRGILETEDTTPHPRVFVLNERDVFAIAKEPLHYDKKNRGTGPGLEFGKKMACFFTESEIGLIPAAVGGTKISYWEPDDERGLYKEAIRKAKVAMKSGTIKGILWQQGESDSYTITEVEKYKFDLIELINSFRKDLGDENIPVVVGGLGNFLKSKYWNRLNEVFQEVAETMDHVGYSEASKLGHIGDSLHFNSAAQRENGRNMADAMRKLLEEARENE